MKAAIHPKLRRSTVQEQFSDKSGSMAGENKPTARFLQGRSIASLLCTVPGTLYQFYRIISEVAGGPLLEAQPYSNTLLARISAISSTLIKRLENIFAAALQTAPEPPSANNSDGPPPPSYVETATEQFQLEVESTALIRAAEEIMVLTRAMKDLWLFGGLRTIRTELSKDDEEFQRAQQMKDDQEVVADVLGKLLADQSGLIRVEGEDSVMAEDTVAV